jgi:hypothetical protein
VIKRSQEKRIEEGKGNHSHLRLPERLSHHVYTDNQDVYKIEFIPLLDGFIQGINKKQAEN